MPVDIQRDESSGTSLSLVRRPLCAVCTHDEARYTCPRCRMHTCSLPCSKTHKAESACSGERNKVKYVKMNEYGWGTMMDDYVFLEHLARSVDRWGREIAAGGWVHERRGGNVRPRAQRPPSKREALRQHLELMDIEMELLPNGMQRARQNESTWDFKTKTARLTIEFIFNPPTDSRSQKGSTFSLLTHRNSLCDSILGLLRTHTAERSGRKRIVSSAIPEWVRDLVSSADQGEASSIPQCLMRAQNDPLLPQGKIYQKLDPAEPLASALRNTSFIEFPTVEIWTAGEFTGMIVDTQGRVTHASKEGRNPKRRKLNANADSSAFDTLLGGYKSEGEDEDVMSLLEDYADEIDEDKAIDLAQEENEEGYESHDSEDETETAVRMDPEALLELVQRVQKTQGHPFDWESSDAGEE